MNAIHKTIGLDVGINVPAEIGMAPEDVSMPTLIVDHRPRSDGPRRPLWHLLPESFSGAEAVRAIGRSVA